MKKLRIPALVLALILLAGCSPKTPAAETNTPGPAPEDDMAYHCVGLTKDFPLVTVDGESVEAEQYLFWLARAIQTWGSYGFLPDEEAWTSMGEKIKADALDVVILYQVMESKAAELGVTFEDIAEELDADLNAVVAQQGGRDAYQSYLDAMCISWEGFRQVNGVYYLNQAILEKILETGGMDGQTIDGYVAENNIYAAKHILLQTRRQLADGSYEEFSDEEKAAVYQKALNLREQLLDENDSEEAFDRLMNEFSEDGRYPNGALAAPDGYTYVYPGRMVPEFEAGALALRVGQVGDIVATDYGYHIILRIPVDREQAAQELLQALTNQWVAQAQVVTDPAYDTIDPKDFYEKLTDLNDLLHPEVENVG